MFQAPTEAPAPGVPRSLPLQPPRLVLGSHCGPDHPGPESSLKETHRNSVEGLLKKEEGPQGCCPLCASTGSDPPETAGSTSPR